MTLEELDAIEAAHDRTCLYCSLDVAKAEPCSLVRVIAALREAWADRDNAREAGNAMRRLREKARAEVERLAESNTRLRRIIAGGTEDGEYQPRVLGLTRAEVADLKKQAAKAGAAIARVRAICTRADNDEFHSPYQVVEFIRDALDGKACPFCTREAQAECESTGGRCSGEDEIDAVLDDRPDLNPREALIAGLLEARAEVEHWKEQHAADLRRALDNHAHNDEAMNQAVRDANADLDEARAEVERLRDEMSTMHRTVVHQCCEDKQTAEAAIARLEARIHELEAGQ